MNEVDGGRVAAPGGPGEARPEAPAGALAEGTEIGGYTVVTLLGRGAMGAVYECVDGGGHAVAVKVLHAHVDADPAGRERLRREVAALQRLRHPAVAQVLDAELDGPFAFVVTELVDGVTLEDEVDERGPLDPQDLYSLADQLADALEAVHTAGIVHRDLKPSNVMVTDQGPVLIDFGIAQGPGDARTTSTGFVMGTPGYIAPELLDGGDPVPETDWWSWAALLVFAATGRSPFGVRPTDLVLQRSREGRPDVVGLPPRTARALAGALHADPSRRWGPTEVARALRRDADDAARAATGMPYDPDATQRIVASEETQRVGLPTQVVGAPPSDGYVATVPPPPVADPTEPMTAVERDRANAHDGGTQLMPVGDARYRPYDELGDDEEEPGPEEVRGYVRPARRRRTGTVLALGLPLVVLGATRPGVAFAVLVGLVVLCRIVATSADALHDRRERKGVRRSDGLLSAVLLPWHVVTGAIGAIPAALVGACVGVLTVVLGFWVFGDGRLVVLPLDDVEARSVGGRNAPIVFCAVLAAAVLLATLATWFGPAGRTARDGARTVLGALAPGLVGAAIVVVLCLVGAWMLGMPVLEDPPVVHWWPMSGPPSIL
ncbi:serine/threonine-protein kinase [Isoptericola variabilis]|uniref:Serine/threonine protein kinase n=1 Tax=Isoptericola variabilis (strain 225) TaxID=743718 RepID=F6FTU9_ISOV2|nr:serine/threonine-protein kinase [Isoptericola variabilis]AEG45320.1 serine/threonine protein kinase [Isoptericola variabilis 225]